MSEYSSITDEGYLTTAVADLVDIFRINKFKKMNLDELCSNVPNGKKDSINMRILRDSGTIFKSEGKPKMISIIPQIDAVIFYLGKYTCKLCGLVKKPKELKSQLRHPDSSPEEYSSYVIFCQSCVSRLKTPTLPERPKSELVTEQAAQSIEYKIVQLTLQSQTLPDIITPTGYQWKVSEWTNVLDFSDEAEEAQSFYVTDTIQGTKEVQYLGFLGILNAYAKDGWELVNDPFLQKKANAEGGLEEPDTYKIILKRVNDSTNKLNKKSTNKPTTKLTR